jgi:transcriptional regulator with XRE-family HTH domain
MDKFSERLKELRLANGMSQEEVAARVGLQKAAIHKYEAGIVKNPRSSLIKELSRIFGRSPSYLMGWEDDDAAQRETEPNAQEYCDKYSMLNPAGKAYIQEQIDFALTRAQFKSQNE